MQGHGRIIAHDFCVAHREANSGLSTLNRTKSILSIYHQQRQLQKQRGMCLNGTYPFCQQPLSGNCHSICFSKPVLWTATPAYLFFRDDFSAQWSPPCIIVFLAKPEEKISNFCRFSFPWQVIFTRHIIIVIIACISSIFNSEILFSLFLFRQNILRYTARYEPSQYHCGE